MDLDKFVLTLYRNPKSAVTEHEFNLQVAVNGKQESITFKDLNEIIRKIALFTFGKNYKELKNLYVPKNEVEKLIHHFLHRKNKFQKIYLQLP